MKIPKVFPSQVSPVSEPLCPNTVREEAGWVPRQLRLMHQERYKREPGHEGVIAGPMAARIDWNGRAVPSSRIRHRFCGGAGVGAVWSSRICRSFCLGAAVGGG